MKKLTHYLIILALSCCIFLVACSGLYRPSDHASDTINSIKQHIAQKIPDSKKHPNHDDYKLYGQIYDTVLVRYVNETDHQQLKKASLNAIDSLPANRLHVGGTSIMVHIIDQMLLSLDSYSTYLDPLSFQRLQEDSKGRFGGLGIQIRHHALGVEIIKTYANTPAEKIGLKKHDIIYKADDILLSNQSMSAIISMLRGPKDSKVNIGVIRNYQQYSEQKFDRTATRAVISTNSVSSKNIDDYLYVRLESFYSGAADNVENILDKHLSRQKQQYRAIIFDLRSNPGGLLREAIDVSNLFLKGGKVVTIKSKHDLDEITASQSPIAKDIPVAILIDNGSASASEIVAGALHDRQRAWLIGTQSYGKGSVQSIFSLGGGKALKLTTAHYLTPAGTLVNQGLKPLLKAEDDPNTDEDEAIDAAIAFLNNKTPAIPLAAKTGDDVSLLSTIYYSFVKP